MRGFGKQFKILAGCVLLLCALMITVCAAPSGSCSGACSHQAAIGTVHYDTIAAAIAAAKSGDTVTLLADVTISSPLRVGKSIVLELGSKALTANLSSAGQSAVSFTADGTLRGGQITANTGSALLVSGCAVTVEKDAVLVSTGTAPGLRVTAAREQIARVNLSGQVSSEGIAVDARSLGGSCEVYVLEDAVITATEYPAISLDCAGKLDIAGGTVQAKADVISVTLQKDRTTELAITGGNILSEEGAAIVLNPEEDAQIPGDFVTGGTFRELPRDYIPAYCKIQSNTDGTFTVLSAYTLTFLANGGTGVMEAVKVPFGSEAVLPACGFTSPTGRDFAGWELDGTVYAPGDTYTPTGNVTLHALWKAHVHTGGTATCLARAVCETCGSAYGTLGAHQLTATGGYAATCTSSGMNAHSVCGVCGNCFVNGVQISASSLTIPALGHKWQSVDGVSATCTEDGCRAYRKCTVCGVLQAEGKTVTEEELRIPALGHNLEPVEAVPATCQEHGTLAHACCTTCGLLFLNGEPVEEAQLSTDLASHVLSDWQSDAYYHWKTCVDCGEVFRQDIHTDSDRDSRCDDCGYAMSTQAQSGEAPGSSPIILICVISVLVIAAGIAAALIWKKRRK